MVRQKAMAGAKGDAFYTAGVLCLNLSECQHNNTQKDIT